MTRDPLWYRDAVIYELRVRSFYDSDGDGAGDLRGLTEKLDYLQDLGVTALWLLPFYPSPLRDDGYDISSYDEVHPECGTLRDFKTFLREAHARGLNVITELVLNHTSDAHPWFQRARRARPGSRERDFYVWSDTPTRYGEARVIFKDFEPSNWAWDPLAKAYYWHRFYSHQPDLNYESPAVRRAVRDALYFWLKMGVDGLRLDAVPYLFERDGTSCENLPETHALLKQLRADIDAKYDNRMLLAEANQWPEDAVAYFGDGDECHMAFHFPIMPRLFMAMQLEDRHPILDILEQTPAIPERCQWALFLRNHDELTLEMVTDEERDYMWRVYARDRRARINLGIRRRLAPLLGNNRRRIELMNALLLSLPGTPVLYYGDEIGMGDNVYLGDRNGVRTPMQWSPDRNAGFSRANPQQLILPVITDPEYHYEAINVDTQQGNSSSLLWWTKRILALRKQFHAFGRGTFEPQLADNRKVLAFVRRFEGETILVVANLSRFSQFVELDLSEFQGRVPLELFGRNEFPPIGELPYLLTMAPHGFYWFSLAERRVEEFALGRGEAARIPAIEVEETWERLLEARRRGRLERALVAYLQGQRWFRSKARRLDHVAVLDSIPLKTGEERVQLTLVEASFAEGEPEVYVMALGFVTEAGPDEDTLARVAVTDRGATREGSLVEASRTPAFAEALLDLLRRRRRLSGRSSEIAVVPAPAFRRLRGDAERLPAHALGAEQSNTSWVYGERLVGKLLRRVEEGESPELELQRHLSRRPGCAPVADLAGHLELRRGRGEPATLGIFLSFVPNEGDAWAFTIDQVEDYFEEIVAAGALEPPAPAPPLLECTVEAAPAAIVDEIHSYHELARLLGRRTAELHAALAADTDTPSLAPETYSPFVRRSLYQSMRNLSHRSLALLRSRLRTLDEAMRASAGEVLEHQAEILGRFERLRDTPLASERIRIHGDYHLGQVLYTGKDFVVIDFEGEPARSLGERRLKRSPLVDVAGMLRSFHYAVESVLLGRAPGSALRPEDTARLAPWGDAWVSWVSGAFLQTYLEEAANAGLLTVDRAEIELLLDVHLLEKALYEIGYELNNRPDWIGVPLRGLVRVLRSGSET